MNILIKYAMFLYYIFMGSIQILIVKATIRYTELGDKSHPTLKLQKSLHRMTFRQSAHMGNAVKKKVIFR